MASASVMSIWWNPNGHKYRCCCNCCHVKSGTKAIAILEAILLFIGVFSWLYLFVSYGAYVILGFLLLLGSLSLEVVILGLVFYGLKKERAGFLLPHIVCQVVSLVSLGILTMAFIAILVSGGGSFAPMLECEETVYQVGDTTVRVGKRDPEEVLMAVGLVGFFAIAISGVFQIWFLRVFLNCYRFLRDKSRNERAMMMEEGKEVPVENPPPYQTFYPTTPNEAGY